MIQHTKKYSSALMLALMMAGMAQAQTGTSAAASGATAPVVDKSHKLPHADTAFLKQAAQNGHAEVEGSKLALTKGVSPQVKTFAQQMVDDHTKAGDELTALAASKGVDVPKSPSVAQKAKLKVLSMRDGASFDSHYAESIGVSAHEDTVKLFKKASGDVKDADVKAFITKTLPTLEHHLQMARDLEAAVGKDGHKK